MRLVRIRFRLRALALGIVIICCVFGALARTPVVLSEFEKRSWREGIEKGMLRLRVANLARDRQSLEQHRGPLAEGAHPLNDEYVRKLEAQVHWGALMVDDARRRVSFYSRARSSFRLLLLVFWNELPEESPPEPYLPPSPLPLL